LRGFLAWYQRFPKTPAVNLWEAINRQFLKLPQNNLRRLKTPAKCFKNPRKMTFFVVIITQKNNFLWLPHMNEFIHNIKLHSWKFYLSHVYLLFRLVLFSFYCLLWSMVQLEMFFCGWAG
jgi:hypothetical protein